MSKVSIVCWTQGGNTQAMAEAIGEGVTAAGGEADVALGCPAMGAEVLEEMEMEPFVQDVEAFANGKKIALFGSYGWGDGQWMRDWEDRMVSAGATLVGGEGVICQEAPDEAALQNCIEIGKQLVNA